MAFNPDEYLASKEAQAAVPVAKQVPGTAAVFDPDAYIKTRGLEDHPIRDALLTGAGAIGTALGAAGGAVRSGIAKVVGLSKPEDRILNAPSTSEYLDRLGVGKGAALSDVAPIYAEPGSQHPWYQPEKGGHLDPSVRGAAGFVGDVALDPLTYLSGGLSAAAKAGSTESKLLKALQLANSEGQLNTLGKTANVVLNPLEGVSRKGAKRAYQQAFERVDSKFEKPETLASIAQEAGFSGTPEQAVELFSSINQKAGKGIGDIYGEAAQKGATVDTMTALSPALQEAQKLRSLGTKESTALASQIDDRVQSLLDTHGEKIPVDVANKVKSDLNSYTNFAQTDTEAIANRARKSVAGPLSQGTKEALKSVDQQLYEKLMGLNNRFSSTSPQVQKKLEQFAAQAATQRGPFGLTKVDAILGGAGGWGALAAKKIADATQSFEGRTARGKLLNQIGQKSNGLADESARQLLFEDALRKLGEKKDEK